MKEIGKTPTFKLQGNPKVIPFLVLPPLAGLCLLANSDSLGYLVAGIKVVVTKCSDKNM